MKRILLALTLLWPLTTKAAERVVTLSVPDMSCPACPFTIEKSLERVEGVDVQQTSLKSKTVRVTVHSNRITDAQLIQATKDAGYDATVRTHDGY